MPIENLSENSSVRMLEDSLINKIAAGEVVERPASVIKELVENSIDAGASRIEVRIAGGGIDLMEVRDDGTGMSFSDARMCLERHATSKISDENDLFRIKTLGFRGEALPSIAAVSRLEILSRRHDMVSGTRVIVEGGRIVEHLEAGSPHGTTIRVSNLFENIPARRKFLKRPETETGHITETLIRIALSHPEIDFFLQSEKRKILSSPGNPDLSERVIAALGRDVAPHLFPLSGSRDNVRVQGLLASPEISRAATRGIFIFVNRRYVRDRSLTHAVQSAYGDMLEKGRSPVVVLFIDLPPDEVDVNVHPQKVEIRFSNQRKIYEITASSVAMALRSSPWAGSAKKYKIGKSDPDKWHAKQNKNDSAPKSHLYGMKAPIPPWISSPDYLSAKSEKGIIPAAGSSEPFCTEPQETGYAGLFGDSNTDQFFFSRLRVIGQFWASYILCESEEGLVLVDQHAAHERIAFEKLKKEYSEQSIKIQTLLFPLTLSPPAGLIDLLEEHMDSFEASGFDISVLKDVLVVRGIPAILAEADISSVITDLSEELSKTGSKSGIERTIDEMLATIACHSVIRAGKALSPEECESLLSRLDKVDNKGSCPHGRPVSFTISNAEIEKRFGRR